MSKPFEDFSSVVAPLLADNIDTDQIIPARFLKGTERTGLGSGLFAGWRKVAEEPDEIFVLDDPRYREAKILLAGENFGCGSSREHAAWALLEAGFQAVLSPRFADIFRNNALGNGLLPITLDEGTARRLAELACGPTPLVCRVELSRQELRWGEGKSFRFEIDPFSKQCLQRGEDHLSYLLSRQPQIASYEALRPSRIDTRVFLQIEKIGHEPA